MARDSDLVGQCHRPVQVFVDERVLNDFEGFSPEQAECKAWKAAYESLRNGFGFGMGTQGFTRHDYSEVCEHLKFNDREGDIRSYIGTEQCLIHRREEYLGLKGCSVLIRIGDRIGRSTVLESMMIAQQYIVCKVLERGLIESNFGETTTRTPRFHGLPFVSTVYCRFTLQIPRVLGMIDFIRILEESVDDVDVEVTRSLLLIREEIISDSSQNAWGGWMSNQRASSGRYSCGTYAVLTLLPSNGTEHCENVLRNIEVYIVVTEDIVRGYTNGKGSTGSYYEYIPPLNPLRKESVRTYILTVGTSIVVPTTYAVRIGADASEDVQVFGYVLRAERLRGEEFKFYSRSTPSIRDNLFEYDGKTDFHCEDFMNDLTVLDFDRFETGDIESRSYTVGIVPSMANVTINSDYRRRLAQDSYNALPNVKSMEDVYSVNPVLRLSFSASSRSERDALPSVRDGVIDMVLDGEQQWVIEDVPYEYFEQLLKQKIAFPFQLADVRAQEREQRDRDAEQSLAADSDEDDSCDGTQEGGDHSKAGESGACVADGQSESSGRTTGEGGDAMEILVTSTVYQERGDRENREPEEPSRPPSVATRTRSKKRRRVLETDDH